MHKILVVDDMPASREALVRALRHEGYQTQVARNGVEGMVKLKAETPDLVLLDQMMPEVDGLTFLTGLRRFPKWKQLPVIMFTGNQNKTNYAQAQNLGVVDYLIKANFTLPELLDRVRKALKPAAPAL
jgi:CheY-like chemotaxis protein